MRYVTDSQEMKRADQNTTEHFKIPSVVLMERAAISVVEVLEERDLTKEKILILCGSGNNGGDGFAIGRILHTKGYRADFLFLGDMSHRTEQTALQMEILKQYGISPVSNISPSEYTIVIDAIFGIGLTRDITGIYAETIKAVNESGAFVLSVDIPSGICADTGKVFGTAVKANVTVTFGYEKRGLFFDPGRAYAGKVLVKDIGITEASFLSKLPEMVVYEQEDLKALPKRTISSNKGTYGKVLVIGGTVSMAGAAYFSGKAAYLTGCGLVRLFVPEENREILQTLLPGAVMTTYERKEPDLQSLKACISWADVIVIGPGLGRAEPAFTFVKEVLTGCAKPTVVDADALNVLADERELLKLRKNIIVTPHVGELSHLTDISISDIKEHLMENAKAFAEEYKIICVLKDARTTVCKNRCPVMCSQWGNHGMSTGGSGDVLTGVIAGLIAQGSEPFDAAKLGVCVHGLAGDFAYEKKGARSLLAEDILDGISEILKKY